MATKQYTEIFTLEENLNSHASREKFLQQQVTKIQEEMKLSGFKYLGYQVNTSSEFKMSVTFFYI